MRSQRSGKNDPDLAATAKALEAAAKAGRPFSSHIKAHPVGISVAGKQPVPKPKSVSLAALDPDSEPMPLQELHSASNPCSFGPSLSLKPGIKSSSCPDTASSHSAAVKAFKGGADYRRNPAIEVDYLEFKKNRSLMSFSRSTVDDLVFKENRRFMSLPRSTGHMKGSSSNTPPAFSKAEVDTMLATLKSRSAGCTSAGQARSSKSSGASSTRDGPPHPCRLRPPGQPSPLCLQSKGSSGPSQMQHQLPHRQLQATPSFILLSHLPFQLHTVCSVATVQAANLVSLWRLNAGCSSPLLTHQQALRNLLPLL